MTIFLFLTASILAVFFVLLPLLRYQSYRDAQVFEQAYRSFQMRTIRRHYAFLRAMPPWEIEKNYDLEILYNSIR